MNASNPTTSFRENGESAYRDFALEVVSPRQCQLECKNCYKKNATNYSRNNNTPVSFAKDAIKQAKGCGFSEVVFIGGEPTLHPSLPLLVHFVLENEMVPIVVTNGVRLESLVYAKEVARPGTTVVLHAPLPSLVQDEEACTPGYSKKLLRAYENVIGLPGVTVVAEVVTIDEFLPHIPAMHQWCLEKGIVPFIEMNRRTDTGVAYNQNSTPEEVAELFKELSDNDPSPPPFLTPPLYGNACTMSITGVHVKNFGDGDYGGVYSCCAQGLRHGDLLKQSLAEVLADPSMVVFKNQDDWIAGPCQTCEHYRVCRGGCRGEASLAFGCYRSSSPSCWHISPDIRSDPKAMMPSTCSDCPLEGNQSCHPRR